MTNTQIDLDKNTDEFIAHTIDIIKRLTNERDTYASALAEANARLSIALDRIAQLEKEACGDV